MGGTKFSGGKLFEARYTREGEWAKKEVPPPFWCSFLCRLCLIYIKYLLNGMMNKRRREETNQSHQVKG